MLLFLKLRNYCLIETSAGKKMVVKLNDILQSMQKSSQHGGMSKSFPSPLNLSITSLTGLRRTISTKLNKATSDVNPPIPTWPYDDNSLHK